MAVMRIHKNKNYTVISNVHLRDKRLSLKAKGLLTLMLSLPEDWDYSVEGLSSICKENRTAIQSALKELEEWHYLKRTKERNEKGQFDCIYNIFEEPQEEQKPNSSGGEKAVSLCPTTAEMPEQEVRRTKPEAENQPPHTLYKQNTNYQVKKQKKETKEAKNTEKKKICLAIISHLNEVTGASYRAETKKTQSLIADRLSEGFALEDFYRVIDKKHREWTGTEFAQYLRPQTLFGEKFEGYLNAPEIPNKSAPKPKKPDILDGIF